MTSVLPGLMTGRMAKGEGSSDDEEDGILKTVDNALLGLANKMYLFPEMYGKSLLPAIANLLPVQ